MVTIRQNIFHQIFEESVSVKISPCQNFVLYGIYSYAWKPGFLKSSHTIIICTLQVSFCDTLD